MRPIDAQELKSRLTIDNTIQLLEYYGAELRKETESYYVFSSFCHNSNSSKLHVYKSSNTLHCFVCGNLDILSIIQDQEGLTLPEAIEWAENFFQLNKHQWGRPKIQYAPKEIVKPEIDVTEKLKTYNPSILNTFIDYQAIEWIQEGISEEVMKMFDIKFDIDSQSIIIPVRDQQGDLVCIRCRNLNEDTIDKYGKYGVYTDYQSGISYRNTTGKLLYGLNVNMKKIVERKRIILVEGEKSVLKSKTWFDDEDITVATYGANLTNFQIEMIKSLGVEDILFCYDREEEKNITKKINNIYKKTSMLFNVYYIDDYKGLIDLKESPFDKDEDVYRELLMGKKKYNLE